MRRHRARRRWTGTWAYNAAGEFEGRGVFRHANGGVYDGEWKADMMEGRGKDTYADGDTYEGEWVAGQREGRGKYTFANGKVDHDLVYPHHILGAYVSSHGGQNTTQHTNVAREESRYLGTR